MDIMEDHLDYSDLCVLKRCGKSLPCRATSRLKCKSIEQKRNSSFAKAIYTNEMGFRSILAFRYIIARHNQQCSSYNPASVMQAIVASP